MKKQVCKILSLYGIVLVLMGALGILFLVDSCGGKSSSDSGASSSNAQSSMPSHGQLIQVPASVSSDDASALALDDDEDEFDLAAPGGVNADSFVVNLSGCSSGLTGNNGSAGLLTVYLHDGNCLGKLTSFVLHTQSYVPTGTGAVAFTCWTAGCTAILRGASSTDLINLQVVSQLSSPIQTTDVVSYNFTINKVGTNNSSIVVSNAQTLTVAGQDAPNFKIQSGGATFNSVVTSGANTGAGVFTFQLLCTTGAMTVGANVSYNSFCPDITAGGTIAGGASGVDIGVTSNFSYKKIADPNGDGTLTLAQARTTFSAGGDTTITLSTDILSGSTGFQTIQLTGPVTIASNQKMILILQAKNTNASYSSNPNYSSFQYFPITLPAVNP